MRRAILDEKSFSSQQSEQLPQRLQQSNVRKLAVFSKSNKYEYIIGQLLPHIQLYYMPILAQVLSFFDANLLLYLHLQIALGRRYWIYCSCIKCRASNAGSKTY